MESVRKEQKARPDERLGLLIFVLYFYCSGWSITEMPTILDSIWNGMREMGEEGA
jgi:hypothetical protein